MKNNLMRVFPLSSLLFSVLGGCAVVDSEKNVSGGYLGYLQDKYIMQADTPEAEVYRALAVTTALSLAAERNAVNHGNIKQAIDQINGITESLSALYSQATTPCGLPLKSDARNRAMNIYQANVGRGSSPDCVLIEGSKEESKYDNVKVPSYSVGFQIQMYRVNKQFFNLAAVSLPEDEFKSLIANATSGNYLGILTDVAMLSREIILTAAPAFAGMRAGKQGRVHGFEERNDDPLNPSSANVSPQSNLIKTGSYREAAEILNTNQKLVEQLKYPTKEAMVGLFREVQQACVAIWSRLPAAHAGAVNCPRDFIGVKMPLTGLYGGKQADAAAKSK